MMLFQCCLHVSVCIRGQSSVVAVCALAVVQLVTALHTSSRSGPSFCASGRMICVDTSFTARPKMHVDKENNARFITTNPRQEGVLTLKLKKLDADGSTVHEC